MKTKLLMGLLILLAAVGACLVIGCGKSGSPTLATVGDEVITLEDFNEYLQNFRITFNSAENEFETKRAALDSMIAVRLLVKAAYEKNIDQLEEVARVVLANKPQFLLDALYQKHIEPQITVSEAEIKDFYNHLDYQIRAMHILVPSEDTANMLFEKLKSGANFEQLAYEYSIDPGAQKNRGDLGYFTWGSMVDEFQEAAFAMEVGAISPPVKSSFGYHIIKLADKRPNEMKQPYQEMKYSIENQILRRKSARITDAYYRGIQGKYPVTIDRSVADYVLHKRLELYPPQLLHNVPKSDFDEKQLDRDERELVLATWEGGQVSLMEYLLMSRKRLPAQYRPDFDMYDSLQNTIFRLLLTDIMAYEASREGLENSDRFARKMHLFKEYTMADVMHYDSLPVPPPPDEEAMRAYYDAHIEEYTVPARIHLYEILVKDEMEAQKLSKIRSLEAFRDKAAEVTQRKGKQRSRGDLGYIEEKWFPNIFAVAWETPIGSIGGPVRTKFGEYSVFYPVDRQPESQRDFLEVKRDIYGLLVKESKAQAFRTWVDEQKAITKCTVNEDVLWESIDRERYGAVDTTATARP
ncbi:MAG: peptidylprolyl isomerase [candidate division Zixibacteria bacterium]|nr:peptidylprolyl isomerase [candidate division Zixibacteria bacterium]